MSNAVSPLQGASYEGYVTVTELGLRGMITLRGDLSSVTLHAAVKTLCGVAAPDVNQCVSLGENAVAWMSPDELLLSLPYDQANAGVEALTKKLAGEHMLASNMSDARAVFQLRGAAVREVLAKLAPLDMSRDAFSVGSFRRSRLAQTPAAIWMREEDCIELVCFRSVADYVFALLSRAAQPGSEVYHF